jgi:hypothetical protein
MPDHFENQQTMLNSPADRIAPVTASDTVDLPGGPCRALLVGTAGNADIRDQRGTLVSTVPLQAGYNPIRVLRVQSTNLTAANIFALY